MIILSLKNKYGKNMNLDTYKAKKKIGVLLTKLS